MSPSTPGCVSSNDDNKPLHRQKCFSPGPPLPPVVRPQRQPLPSLSQIAERIENARLRREERVFSVEVWLGRCLDQGLAPPKKCVEYFRAPTFEDFLTPDLVECVVTITERECTKDGDGIFVNESIFRLHLNVYVPPECGFLCYVAHSPTVTLDKWKGLLDDTSNRPGWLDYHGAYPLKFWQPRATIVDLISMYRCRAFNADNNCLLQRWVEGVTRGSWADLKAATLLRWGPTEVLQTIPSNSRSHKPCASTMTEEEARTLQVCLRAESVPPDMGTELYVD
ncbi:hypothetical protein EST38_g13388 [Candolleomyces aberdarensis]|uniref:Uncharacterized protein n=1 Tax=Candolleomyces aberdarensis TaxID=2316362 RepID=A0A4Q2CZX9_9AGAR|nr:hypothetical protein EST38_g13388 [Candolleomyces aberdarensis]